jgi:type VI secretion system protein ImpM
MTTGFFGKIPATGDFVARNLTSEFVRTWDMWVAQHLMPFVSSGEWADDLALFFIAGPDFMEPMAGVIVPSCDKVGRRFPLTIAAETETADTMLIVDAHEWFETILNAAQVAARGEVDVDGLGAYLAALQLPRPEETFYPVRGLCLWVDPQDVSECDTTDPSALLKEILNTSARKSAATE